MFYKVDVSPPMRRRRTLPRVLRARSPDPTLALGAASAPTLDSAFQHAPVAMAVLEPGGRLLRANPALSRLLGRPLQDLVGTTLFTHTHPDDLEQAVAACGDISHGRVDLMTLECRLLRPDGQPRTTVVTTSLVRDLQRLPAHLVLHVQDVTDLRALESDLRHKTLHDALTGLPNRVLLIDRLAQTIAACGRADSTFVLMFVDVDEFKQVNDRYGHDTGDVVLIELAVRMQDAVRPGDTVARLAGDEFLVLCPDVDAHEAEELCRRLLEQVCRPVPTSQGDLKVTVSAGLAFGNATSDPAALLRQADQQMYRSKSR